MTRIVEPLGNVSCTYFKPERNHMRKTLRTFGLASVLLTGVAATGFAATPETPADRSQGVTGTHQAMPGTPTGSMNSTAGINSTRSAPTGPDATRPAAQLPSGGEGTGGASGGGAGAGSR